ncbi:uncharacterized protein METZ01_LOCUS327144, partial [marine metagenome]
TSRLQSFVDAMSAIVALRRGIREGINVEGIIGTRLHTRFTANTSGGIEVDDPIIATEESLRGTDRHAGRVVTLVAPQYGKMAARVGKRALFYILYPGSKGAEGNFIFRFTGNGTGMASNAAGLINYEPVSHGTQCPAPRKNRQLISIFREPFSFSVVFPLWEK